MSLGRLSCTEPGQLGPDCVFGVQLEETATFPGNFLGVVSLSASSDGKLCAVSSMDGRLRVLNLDDKVVQRTIDPGPVEAWTVLPSQK